MVKVQDFSSDMTSDQSNQMTLPAHHLPIIHAKIYFCTSYLFNAYFNFVEPGSQYKHMRDLLV